MTDQIKKAFEFAQDATKQFTTLSTGMIALTITFSKEFLGPAATEDRDLALWAWAAFIASVFFGLWTLLALTGTLEPVSKGGEPPAPSIRQPNITIPSALQIITFFAGLVLTVLFGARSVS